MKRKPLTMIDFSGGLFSGPNYEVIPNNGLLKADNMWWDERLEKRKGINANTTSTTNCPGTIRGAIRVYMNSTWSTIYAIDDGSEVNLYVETSGAFTIINTPSAYALTTALEVTMTTLNNKVVGVNGTDKPFIVYYDSAYKVEDLEAYDTRTRTNDDWYAGQFDDGATTEYINDTTDAQDVGADDFGLATTTANDGFFVAGVVTFNKVVLSSVDAFTGSPVASYQYYNTSGTWTDLTLVTTPAWGTGGDLTLEFDIPTDWGTFDTDIDFYVTNRYVMRVRFTTAPTNTPTCDSITVYHTQYLSLIMGGEIPHTCWTHNNRVFLAAGNNVNFSPYDALTGWQEYATEVFDEGGPEVQAGVSLGEALLVFKGSCIYAMLGNSFENFQVKKLVDGIGTKYGKTVQVAGQTVWFLSQEGRLYGFNGSLEKRFDSHVTTYFSSRASSSACSVVYGGDYYLSLPDGASSVIVRIDPDSARDGELGEGLVSVWPYATGAIAEVDGFILRDKDGDDGKLYGWVNLASSEEVKDLFSQTGYDTDSAAADQDIAAEMETNYQLFGSPLLDKSYHRVKVHTSSWDSAATHTITVDTLEDTALSYTPPDSDAGLSEFTLHYRFDGTNLKIGVSDTSDDAFYIRAIAAEVGWRVY